jgi:hypothetical protein
MNKNTWTIVAAIVIVILGVTIFLSGSKNQSTSVAPIPTTFDPTNATYTIDGQPVTLIHGANSSTSLFGQPVSGDLNSDGKADAVVILVQNPGGSGTFYYVAAAINAANGIEGTNAVLLGDRIAPENLQIIHGEVIVNYADRKPNDPMSTPPSVGVSKYLTVNGTTLVEASPAAGPGERCGGNMTTAPVCQTGYHCAPTPGSHLPFGDVGGTCVAN